MRGKYIAISSLLAIQAMFGNFGALDDGDRHYSAQIRGVGKPEKPRKKKAGKGKGHRRTYTHGKPWTRV